jgi:hypothetical protein
MEDKHFNVGELFGFDVVKYQKKIINASVIATQKFNLRTQLDYIKVILSQKDLRVTKDLAYCFKLTQLDVILGILEDADKMKLFKTLENKLMDNKITCSSQKIDLVTFEDAIAHLCLLCRILRQPHCNAMLIGINGCSKQSMIRLDSFKHE